LTNVPNLLTLIRIFLVPLLIAALVQQNFRLNWNNRVLVANDTFALIVFLAAAATDLLDGYLARRWKQVTTVGTLLDPIADKLLISAALIALVEIRLLPGWLVILIIGREFAVSGLRSIAAAEGYTIRAGELGKSKMMFQVLGITLVMLSLRWAHLRPYALAAMWVVVIFGLASAIDYFRSFWGRVDTSIKLRRRHELLTLERQKRRLRRATTKNEAKSPPLAAAGQPAETIRRSG